jgi:hypothetical protein
MLLLIGPAVAVIGVVAVIFVMRHKAVEKRSMYSSRRSQIEHKVRAARQRTLAPARRAEKANRHSDEVESAPAPALTYEPSAYAAPPVASPPRTGYTAPSQPAWEEPAAAPPPTPPPFAPAPPQYEPPAYEPPAAEPPAWTPSPPPAEPAEPVQPARQESTPAVTSAGGGASWSVVGETKASAEPEPAAKKRSKGDTQTGAWTLASGEVAGEDMDEAPKKPAAALAIAQYAVLVVGLVMVLIGVVVMVANSGGS